jgi:RNA polymerase sigma-70 factor (ECF subfamily)
MHWIFLAIRTTGRYSKDTRTVNTLWWVCRYLGLPDLVKSLTSFNEIDVPWDEEHILIHSAQKGDRQAFAVLIERYWDRLYRWLYHLTHHRHTAEDLVQETLLKAFANLIRFRAGSNFQAWLFRIAYNNFVNHWRAPDRVRQVFPQNLASREEGPVEQVLSREALQLLARAVGRLPSDYRAAFLLRVEEGLSFQEIADVLGIKEETARWRVFKARQKLMGVLAPQLEREEL